MKRMRELVRQVLAADESMTRTIVSAQPDDRLLDVVHPSACTPG